ncbi:MAG TPA: hypothetical protein VGH89_10735 [Pseudonocardia sp.]
MDSSAQRLCAYSGIACIVVFLLGFWVIAGFIPPPSPRLTGPELVTLFQSHATRIRIGMMVSLFAAALLASWAAVITVQMRRMEGGSSALAFTNLAVGALFVLEFVISLVLWQVCTFRPERSPDIVQAINDTAWFLFVCITSTPALQASVMGIAVLRDERAEPIFPRWAGYLNLWVAVLFLPGTITVFFKTGPFAWNGLFTWYLPLTVFFNWMTTNTVLTLRAITAQEAAPADTGE